MPAKRRYEEEEEEEEEDEEAVRERERERDRAEREEFEERLRAKDEANTKKVHMGMTRCRDDLISAADPDLSSGDCGGCGYR